MLEQSPVAARIFFSAPIRLPVLLFPLFRCFRWSLGGLPIFSGPVFLGFPLLFPTLFLGSKARKLGAYGHHGGEDDTSVKTSSG